MTAPTPPPCPAPVSGPRAHTKPRPAQPTSINNQCANAADLFSLAEHSKGRARHLLSVRIRLEATGPNPKLKLLDRVREVIPSHGALCWRRVTSTPARETICAAHHGKPAVSGQAPGWPAGRERWTLAWHADGEGQDSPSE
jgi:hypothetical protein